jgi:molybdopterin converting factor subunit 1
LTAAPEGKLTATMAKIRVDYFAVFRERTGRASEHVDTRAETVEQLYRELDARYRFPRLNTLKVAVNDEFRDWNCEIRDGDSVVFIPPVAGG